MKFEECKSCPLYNAPGPVFGTGPTSPLFIYVGQNPAYMEVRQGEPFVGPTGNVLNRMLFEAGVPRSKVYITNQVKCETPGNRPPTLKEVKCCEWILKKELSRINSDVVVLAGDIAFAANVGTNSEIKETFNVNYTPTAKIGERGGAVEQLHRRKWIGTIHPSFFMRQPKYRRTAVDHLRKAAKISSVVLPSYDVLLSPSDSDVREVAKLIKEKTKVFSDDVETESSALVSEEDAAGHPSNKITMCGISWAPRSAILLYPEQLPLLKEVFEDPTVTRFEHNGEFDNFFIKRYIPVQRNLRLDTMNMRHWHLSYAYKRLKPDCSTTYTTLPYYNRDLSKVNEPLYCCFDVMATLEAGEELVSILRRQGSFQGYLQYGAPLPEIFEEWRNVGINVDARRTLFFIKLLNLRLSKAKALLEKITPVGFNPNSYQQMRWLLYDVWKLPVQTALQKSRKGERSTVVKTDFEAKKRLKAWINETPERQEKYKQARLFLDLTDYIEGEQAKLDVLERINPDSKIHPFFKEHGASSFRIASSPNVQNIPKHDVLKWGTSSQDSSSPDPLGFQVSKQYSGSLRSIVVPDDPENDWLLTIDYEQIELWVYAVQFGVKWLLEMYEQQNYIYGMIFEEFLKRPFFKEGQPKRKWAKREDVTESELKHIKAIPLGFLYGRNAQAVALEYGIPLKEAEKMRQWWFERNPELLEAYKYIQFQLTQKGYYQFPWGNRVWWPEGKLTEAYNTFGQTPAAMILRGSIILLNKAIKRWNLPMRMVLSVHDSLTFNIQGTVNVVPMYEKVIAPIVSRPIPELKNFVFRHSADVGKRWDWEDISYDKWKLVHSAEVDESNSHFQISREDLLSWK